MRNSSNIHAFKYQIVLNIKEGDRIIPIQTLHIPKITHSKTLNVRGRISLYFLKNENNAAADDLMQLLSRKFPAGQENNPDSIATYPLLIKGKLLENKYWSKPCFNFALNFMFQL